VRSRRRDVSRQRSTRRQPGQPPPELDRGSEKPTRSSRAASVAGRASRLASRKSPGFASLAEASDTGPVVLDPTETSAPAFALHAGLTFTNMEPLRLALTHRSVLHDWSAAGLSAVHLGRPLFSNERLEFLGDAMLGAIVADELYRNWPDADEGTLTAQRVALVRSETLVRWARDLRLGDYLVLGNGERVSDSPRDRILAGAFEALVGAVSIDQGIEAARAFVGRFLRLEHETDHARPADPNPKGTLQEVVQDRFATQPVYETVGESGPDHDKVFTVAVLLRDERIGLGSGISKRAAQQDAARMALATLADRPSDRSGSTSSAVEPRVGPDEESASPAAAPTPGNL
jgi:ribonuclease-3